MLFPSDYGFSIPRWLEEFEKAYDKDSGGWRLGSGLCYGSVEVEVGRLLHSLVLVQGPMTVLETGTFRGYSTSCIASALKHLGGDRVVYTIDPSPADSIWVGKGLERNVRTVRAKSQDVVDMFAEVDLDMLFLDSDHNYDVVIEEIRSYEPRLVVGGLLIMHDVLFFDGVGAAFRQLADQGRFEHILLDTPRGRAKGARTPGLSIMRKKSKGAPPDKDEKFRGLFLGERSSTPVARVAIG